MTVDELRKQINAALSLGDVLKRFIPGEVDDRILEYVAALAKSDELLQLVIDDFLGGGDDGPFLGNAVSIAGFDTEGLDPATIAIIIQLVQMFGPLVVEWIKRRRNR